MSVSRRLRRVVDPSLPPWYAGRVTKADLVARELALAEAAQRERKDPFAVIEADRLGRWTTWVHAMTRVPQELHDWAERMRQAHGPTVRVWQMDLPWLIALLVVRYGEAEYWWPAEFQPDDVVRARRWEAGEIPAGVRARSGQMVRA